MVTIDVYYTHIEVYPYKLGDAPRIEKIFSKYDNVTHKYVPIGYYIEDSVLYLPRGANIVLLQKIFNVNANFALDPDNYYSFDGGRMLFEPRNKIQTEAIILNILLYIKIFPKINPGKEEHSSFVSSI